MKRGLFTVENNVGIAPGTYRMVLSGDTSDITGPGQFVNIALEGRFLRRPISVCDCEEGRVTIIYKVVGSDLPSLYDRVEVNNKIVVDFLHANGIKDEEISINAPKVQNNVAESWSNDRAFDYGLTQVITVKSQNVDLVNKLLISQKELIKKNIPITAGNYDAPQIRYNYSGLNDIKPDMIKEATQNARLAAEQFANDSGSSVGEIKHATQGQFSIEDRDENTPYIKTVRVVTTVEFTLD